MAKDKPNERQRARRRAARKRKMPQLSKKDLERIEAGEFRVDRVDLLRLQRDQLDVVIWQERVNGLRDQIQRAQGKGQEAVAEFEATLKAVREKWALPSKYGVILAKGDRAGLVVEVQEQVAPMVPCPGCKQQMPVTFAFCGACGAELKDEDKKQDSPEPALEAEGEEEARDDR